MLLTPGVPDVSTTMRGPHGAKSPCLETLPSGQFDITRIEKISGRGAKSLDLKSRLHIAA